MDGQSQAEEAPPLQEEGLEQDLAVCVCVCVSVCVERNVNNIITYRYQGEYTLVHVHKKNARMTCLCMCQRAGCMSVYKSISITEQQ